MASDSFMASDKLPAFLHKGIAYSTSKAGANSYSISLASFMRFRKLRIVLGQRDHPCIYSGCIVFFAVYAFAYPHTAYLSPPPLRRRQHYSELTTRCVINPFLPSAPSSFHPHPQPAHRTAATSTARSAVSLRLNSLKLKPTPLHPALTRYLTPRPSHSLIPQRRLGTRSANSLQKLR
ncbi:hypothetical protein R3P38DRAFT_3548419 [Favolaschia claudopus]|uniref:Uncharacterized protein n=1 Tax=Favolaschia claudopus TaxID=2862362 RepID=A0AAW0B599_9AGAR